ncbi:unnamed protein product [Discosporangium mesarthrocarpum]
MHLMNSRVVALVRQVPKTFSRVSVHQKEIYEICALPSARSLELWLFRRKTAIKSDEAAHTPIDYALATAQHAKYVESLSQLVDTVEVIPGDNQYPDCPFVEDTVVYARGTAVTLQLGHPTRRGETKAVREALESRRTLGCVRRAEFEDPEAFCDGGDVLFTGRHMFVGLSERTNEAGVAALRKAFGPSLPVLPVQISGALHLKSLVTVLRPGVLVYAKNEAGLNAVASMASQVGEKAYTSVGVPDQTSANVVCVAHEGRWRGTLVQGGRCPESLSLIRRCFSDDEQTRVLEVEYSEMIKPDAALTCCSVLLGGQP